MKNHVFSPLCRVLEIENFGRGQKVFFVKRESFLIKSPLKQGGIFTFLFSQLCELKRKRVKKFFQYTTCVYEVVSPRLIQPFLLLVGTGTWGCSETAFIYLNYYLSDDVCARFRLRLSASVCLSASANFLMVAYIKECQYTKLTHF